MLIGSAYILLCFLTFGLVVGAFMGAQGLCGWVTGAGELAWRRWSARTIPIPRGSAWLSLKFGIMLSRMGIIGIGWDRVCLSELLFIVCLENSGVEGKGVAIIVAVEPLQFLKLSTAKPLRSVRQGKTVASQGLLNGGIGMQRMLARLA